MTAGTLRNTIVLGPGEYDSENPPLISTGGAIAYCCSPSLTSGVDGNIAGIPAFKDRAAFNYTVRADSKTVDAGLNQDWMSGATDLAGNPRIKRATVDIGCYECVAAGLSILVR